MDNKGTVSKSVLILTILFIINHLLTQKSTTFAQICNEGNHVRNGVGIKVQIQASDFGLRFSVFLRE
jgi:hypothetical protein